MARPKKYPDELVARGERHGLRGYDAVHLASALGIGEPELVVATWAHDLAGAAVACGCTVPARP